MQLVFSNQSLPSTVVKSLFLAGPSPRSLAEPDWRHEALRELQALGYDGHVIIPIPDFRFEGESLTEGANDWTYDHQVEWEVKARLMADVIVFWVSRTVDRSKVDLGMPAFTTNFELGEDLHTGKVLYGRPPMAVKCRYLDERVQAIGLRVHEALPTLLEQAVQRVGAGAARVGGESKVPLHIWQSEPFQGWYQNLLKAGNRLDGAELVNCVMVGADRQHLFTFTLKVNVWVASEQRHKSNEVILSRKDVSAVFAFCKQGNDVRVALVREFRSPVSNAQGFVYELPGGSSHKPGTDPRVCAQEELHEEMGLHVEDATRFVPVGQRQLAATFSTHRACTYGIELTEQEFAQIEQAAHSGVSFGAGDSEQTYAVAASLRSLHQLPVDYSTLGMVFEAAQQLGLLTAGR